MTSPPRTFPKALGRRRRLSRSPSTEDGLPPYNGDKPGPPECERWKLDWILHGCRPSRDQGSRLQYRSRWLSLISQVGALPRSPSPTLKWWACRIEGGVFSLANMPPFAERMGSPSFTQPFTRDSVRTTPRASGNPAGYRFPKDETRSAGFPGRRISACDGLFLAG